jgi:hypothetical protein
MATLPGIVKAQQTGGPYRVCLRDDPSTMSDTMDGGDCAVIDGEIGVSLRRRNGKAGCHGPFDVIGGGPIPVLKEGFLRRVCRPVGRRRFYTLHGQS